MLCCAVLLFCETIQYNSYYCPAGSTKSEQSVCPAGTCSPIHSSASTDCTGTRLCFASPFFLSFSPSIYTPIFFLIFLPSLSLSHFSFGKDRAKCFLSFVFVLWDCCACFIVCVLWTVGVCSQQPTGGEGEGNQDPQVNLPVAIAVPIACFVAIVIVVVLVWKCCPILCCVSSDSSSRDEKTSHQQDQQQNPASAFSATTVVSNSRTVEMVN